MELRIRATGHFFMAGDVMVRLWQGRAAHDDGTVSDVVALVTAVSFRGQVEALADGLISIPPPTPAEAAQWAREILKGQEIANPED